MEDGLTWPRYVRGLAAGPARRPRLVPPDKRLHGEGVTKLVDRRPRPRQIAEPHLAQEANELPANVLLLKPGAGLREKEARASGPTDDPIALVGIGL